MLQHEISILSQSILYVIFYNLIIICVEIFYSFMLNSYSYKNPHLLSIYNYLYFTYEILSVDILVNKKIYRCRNFRISLTSPNDSLTFSVLQFLC